MEGALLRFLIKYESSMGEKQAFYFILCLDVNNIERIVHPQLWLKGGCGSLYWLVSHSEDVGVDINLIFH